MEKTIALFNPILDRIGGWLFGMLLALLALGLLLATVKPPMPLSIQIVAVMLAVLAIACFLAGLWRRDGGIEVLSLPADEHDRETFYSMLAQVYPQDAISVAVSAAGFSEWFENEEIYKRRIREVGDAADTLLRTRRAEGYKAVCVLRIQGKPDGDYLAPSYVALMQRLLTEYPDLFRIVDGTTLHALPYMAVVERKGGGGFVVETLEEPRPTPRAGKVRRATLIWKMVLPKSALREVKDRIWEYQNLEAFTPASYERRFLRPMTMPAPAAN